MSKLCLVIIADDPLARAGLAMLLANDSAFKVAAQLAPDDDLPAQIDPFQPDILVWDFGWDPGEPSSEGELTHLDLIDEIEAETLPILGLVADDSHVAQIWASGIHDLLLRTASQEQLGIALKTIEQGLNVVDPALTSALISLVETPFQPQLIDPLTPRELEVLQLLAEGLSNKAMAHKLNISQHTIKFHVNAIMSKLNAQSRTHAAVKAARMGLILL